MRIFVKPTARRCSAAAMCRWPTSCSTGIRPRLVGKLVTPTAIVPFLLPIHRTDDGELFVDTCLTTSAEASIVFGFARSYFMVYARCLPPVEWLRGSCRAKPPPSCIWRLAVRSMPKRKVTGNTCAMSPRRMSSLSKRRYPRHGDAGLHAAGIRPGL